MTWYHINARGSRSGRAETAEIYIYGDIGESWNESSVTAAQFVMDLQAVNAETLVVRINSFGGSVPDGLAIYNALSRFDGIVDVHIDGVALLIASLIAMAGDTVTMAANAQLMVHAPWAIAIGNSTELREQADLLDRFAESMTGCYGRGDVDLVAVKHWLADGKDHWFSAQEAMDAGLVDAVGEAQAAAARFDSRKPYRTQLAAMAAVLKGLPMPTEDDDQVLTRAQRRRVARTEEPRATATADIMSRFQPYMTRSGVPALFAQALGAGVSPDAAGKMLLDHLGRDIEPARPAGSHPHIATLHDETDKQMDARVQAILARAGVAGQKADSANPFRGYRLIDHARASLDRAGVRVDGASSMEIAGAALSRGGFDFRAGSITQGTTDFPVLLENTMHKALQASYAAAPDTWRRFCATGSVVDFRPHKRYRTGSLSNIERVNELAEFKNKAIPDGEASSIAAITKGNIVTISRQAIINDDLGSFIGLASQMGRAASRTVESDVYVLLAENAGAGPTMGDGKALFHVDHGNLAASAQAPSVTAVETARTAMGSQMDVSGNDFLDLRPAVALSGLGYGSILRLLNQSQYDPDASNKLQRPNLVAGLFRDVVDSPRIATTRWYIFADPSIAPVFEVVFLDGVQEPYLELQNGFTVDGALYKVRLDYGVGAIDWKGAFMNPGL